MCSRSGENEDVPRCAHELYTRPLKEVTQTEGNEGIACKTWPEIDAYYKLEEGGCKCNWVMIKESLTLNDRSNAPIPADCSWALETGDK